MGASFGLLLGLLVVSASNHRSDARTQAQSEATTLVAMFDDLSVFPPQVRITAQHTVVCYMRSVIDQDWKAQERGGTHEAPDTIVRGDQLRSLKSTLPAGSPHEQSAYGRVAQEIDAAGTARQQLLFLSSQQLATILWAVVLVSAGGLMFFVVSESRSRRNIIQHAVLAAVILLLTFEIGSIVVLDHPFDPLARVQPSAMTHALGLLQAGRENQPEFRACGPATRSGST